MVMLLFVITGVLFFTANVATSATDCTAEGTFCLQVNTDSTYSYQVPSRYIAKAAMRIAIKRSSRQGKFYGHEWSVELSNDMQEMRGNISFIPEREEHGKLMLVLTGGGKYLVNNKSKEWRDNDWRDISSTAFWGFFPATQPELLPHSLRFNSSAKLDEFLGLESKKMFVYVSLKYWTDKGLKYNIVRTKNALRLFVGKKIGPTPPESAIVTPERVTPGKTVDAKNDTGVAVAPKLGVTDTQHEDKDKKDASYPFIIAGLVVLICVLLAGVSYLAYAAVAMKSRSSRSSRTSRR